MSHIKDKIVNSLKQIEAREQVNIIYACESGSRAWGFPSQDSDYDVRFIYVRPIDWYLSIFDKRDVIEMPIDEKLDINGWDLRKALNLFRKSNPPLLEWLQSPIVYSSNEPIISRLRTLAGTTFSAKSCTYHYLHMAKGNYREYLQGDTVKIKKYFYVLRPILACQWITRYGTMPPMEFEQLVDTLLNDQSELRGAIQQLLARKKAGDELDYEPKIGIISEFIEQQLAYLEQRATFMPQAETDQPEALDELFRAIVKQF